MLLGRWRRRDVCLYDGWLRHGLELGAMATLDIARDMQQLVMRFARRTFVSDRDLVEPQTLAHNGANHEVGIVQKL